jgi:serine/threonine protein kinase/Flp pilus assembly protein TadD
MAKQPIFGKDPEKISHLLSIGEDEQDLGEVQGDVVDSPVNSDSIISKDQVIERLHTKIEGYRIIKVLGEGGMGIVYLAEQQYPVQRQVALKIIKPGMDSKRIIARFEAEQQALARLDHPNIAHVYGGGTTELDRPYFVMEYIQGIPITDYCDQQKLTIKDRLNLFLQVCQAVQHAHQKGIIHRDIKPSNILVSVKNDRAIPKIIDFGVAKATGKSLTEHTIQTEDTQLLGTPEYMSPEQADMATEDIDTRSDVYSLGVLLYVLLTGVLPFDSDTFRTGGLENIRRTIRETDPKTPSTRLSKLGEEARKIAENRRAEIHTLTRHLRKELEWIPLKAMRKERTDRYRSASELADDIENYLTGSPLIAGPPGTGYKLKKFVQRNRILVGGIAAVLIVLILGVVGITIFAIKAERRRTQADLALSETQLITDFLENDVLGSAEQANLEETTVIYILDAASKSLAAGKFKDKPTAGASLYLTLGTTYTRLGEYDKGEQHIRRAIEIYRQHLGEAHPDTLEAMGSIAWNYHKQGRSHKTAQIYTRILQLGQGVLSVEQQMDVKNMLGAAYMGLGEYKKAELLYDEILQIVQSEFEEDFWLLPYIKKNLAVSYLCQGRYNDAEQLLKELIRADEESEDYAGIKPGLYKSMGVTYTEQGRYGEAEKLLKDALKELRQKRGYRHPIILSWMLSLSQLHIEQERYAEAEVLLQEALQIAREKMGPEQRLTLNLMNAYAVLHTKKGQYDQAEKLFDEVLKGRQSELGDDHPATLETLNDFGILRREQQQYDEAESLLRQALDGRQRKLGRDHPAYFESMHELAVLYEEQGDYEKAEPLLLEAVEGCLSKLGDKHPHTIESLNNLIALYEAWNKPEETEKWRAKLPKTKVIEE